MQENVQAHGLQPVGLLALFSGLFRQSPRSLRLRGDEFLPFLEPKLCAHVYALGPEIRLPRQIGGEG